MKDVGTAVLSSQALQKKLEFLKREEELIKEEEEAERLHAAAAAAAPPAGGAATVARAMAEAAMASVVAKGAKSDAVGELDEELVAKVS